MPRALVLCTGNSCRSQMAEELFKLESSEAWQADSAGSNPAGYVHPMAITAMGELGCDLSNHQSQHLDEFTSNTYDLVVTVCDNAKESCPVFPNATRTVHWPFEDPAYAVGTDDEKMIEFRRIRDQIRERIRLFLQTGN